MDEARMNEIVGQIEEYGCKAEVVGDEYLYKLSWNNMPTESTYLIQFFDVNDAGDIAIKIRWLYGMVENHQQVVQSLFQNTDQFIHLGCLFAGLYSVKDQDLLLVLLGHMIFPKEVSPDIVGSMLWNNAFVPYAMFKREIPGVRNFIE